MPNLFELPSLASAIVVGCLKLETTVSAGIAMSRAGRDEPSRQICTKRKRPDEDEERQGKCGEHDGTEMKSLGGWW